MTATRVPRARRITFRPSGQPQRSGATRAEQAAEAELVWVSTSWRRHLLSPLGTYHLLLVVVGTMVGFGLVMVLSASSFKSFRDTGSSYAVFLNQLLYVGVGLAGAWLASRCSAQWWRRLAVPGMGLAVALLLAVAFTPLGHAVLGNRNWLYLGPVRVQPSEFGKLALVVFGASALSRRWRHLGHLRAAMVPFVVPGAVALLGLVMLGHDLGTALVLVAIVLGMLFVAGVPLRWFVGFLALCGAGVALAVVTSRNRMGRIADWLSPCTDPTVQGCWQRRHGEFAFADGGWFGVGLGGSKEKISWLPEPHNDFILAIVGEELGLPGTMLVLLLFGLLTWACYRVIVQSDDPFVRLATGGVMVWLLGQAMINIASVLGLMPIIGVPLPLVSSGGSALISALTALGMVVSFARRHPDVETTIPRRRLLRGLRGRFSSRSRAQV